MRTLGKILAWLISIIIVLYIILWIVLHYAISPRTYKALVENATYKLMGREMIINGEFAWSVFPNPTIKITDVLIKNTNSDQTASPYFAKINETDLQVNLASLFSGKIIPKQITLRGADFNIVSHRAQHNLNNTADITRVSEQTTAATTMTPTSTPNALTVTVSQLPQVTILNTAINWINPEDNKTIHFKNINLTLLPGTDAVWVKGTVDVINAKQLTKLKLSTYILSHNNNTQVTLDNLRLDGTTTLNNTVNSLSYNGSITIDFINQTLSIPSYILNWNGLPLSGSSSNNWKKTDSGLTVNFTTSLNVANGLINEQGTFNAPDSGNNSINYVLTISHIQLAPVLKALHHDNLIKGSADLSATLTSTNTNQNWLANLNGTGNFKLINTQLGTLNFENYINQAMSLLHGKPTQNNAGITIFSTITGTFKINNGVFANNDLRMNATDFHSTGSGTINMNTNIIDYLLVLQQNNNKNFNLPIKITGNIQQPLIKVDLKNLSKIIIKNTLKEKGQELKKLFHDQGVDLKKIF